MTDKDIERLKDICPELAKLYGLVTGEYHSGVDSTLRTFYGEAIKVVAVKMLELDESLAAARIEIGRLKGMFRVIEWDGDNATCLFCGGRYDIRHKKNCLLAALLAEKEKEGE